MLSLGDFIRKRSNRGEKWPTKELIYQWKYWNYFQFADECIRMLGSKILIDEDAFEVWLKKNSHKTQEADRESKNLETPPPSRKSKQC